jgi:YEATS family
MTNLQREVLFYIFAGFFVLIGIGSLMALLGLIQRPDPAFRKWAVGGFIGAVTTAVVGLFRLSFLAAPALITVTLVPPPDAATPLVLDHGTYQYDEVADSGKVTTQKGEIVAVAGDDNSWQVRLPGEVSDKAVRLNFQDAVGNPWVAGPFYPNYIQQKMRAGQKATTTAEAPGTPRVPLAMAVVFAAEAGTTPARQRQADVTFNNYARSIGNQGGRPYFEWRVFVDEKPQVLNTIAQVDYLLHPTFPDPFRTSRDRDKHFELIASGWGTFRIVITIHYTNGSEAKTSYTLDFDKSWPAPASAKAKLDKIRVVQTGSAAATGWVFDISVDGKKMISLPKRDYVNASGRNEYSPEAAGRWDLGDVKIEGGGGLRVDITGHRTTGSDTVSGTGTLKAGGQVDIAVANKQDPRKGSFVFTFSAS